jgi:hypothetical protein
MVAKRCEGSIIRNQSIIKMYTTVNVHEPKSIGSVAVFNLKNKRTRVSIQKFSFRQVKGRKKKRFKRQDGKTTHTITIKNSEHIYMEQRQGHIN